MKKSWNWTKRFNKRSMITSFCRRSIRRLTLSTIRYAAGRRRSTTSLELLRTTSLYKTTVKTSARSLPTSKKFASQNSLKSRKEATKTLNLMTNSSTLPPKSSSWKTLEFVLSQELPTVTTPKTDVTQTSPKVMVRIKKLIKSTKTLRSSLMSKEKRSSWPWKSTTKRERESSRRRRKRRKRSDNERLDVTLFRLDITKF